MNNKKSIIRTSYLENWFSAFLNSIETISKETKNKVPKILHENRRRTSYSLSDILLINDYQFPYQYSESDNNDVFDIKSLRNTFNCDNSLFSLNLNIGNNDFIKNAK